MPSKKPRSRKQKGKKLEEKVSDIIHEILYKLCKKYRIEFDKNEKIRPRRDFSSGTFKHNPCDIELNYAYTFLPFCIECKNWSEFKTYSIFDLFKENSKLLSTLIKIYNDYKKDLLPDNSIRLVVFKSDYTDILVLCKLEHIPNQIIDNLTIKFIDKRRGFIITKLEDFIEHYIKYNTGSRCDK